MGNGWIRSEITGSVDDGKAIPGESQRGNSELMILGNSCVKEEGRKKQSNWKGKAWN